MLSAFGSGFLLGLALIIPIGPQNMFVMESALQASPRAVAWVVATSALCDALLIAVGTAGIGSALGAIPSVRRGLLAAGAAFLAYIGARTLLARGRHESLAAADAGPSPRRAGRRAMAMSLLNPHAVLDTVGIIGVAAAAQRAASRPLFAGGAVAASIVWFSAIALGAAALRRKLTPRVRQVIDLCSGLVLIGFATAFLLESLRLAAKG